MSTSQRIDRRTLLKLGTTGAVMLGAGAPRASAQEKPKKGGTLTIGRKRTRSIPDAPPASPRSRPTSCSTTGSSSTTSR